MTMRNPIDATEQGDTNKMVSLCCFNGDVFRRFKGNNLTISDKSVNFATK